MADIESFCIFCEDVRDEPGRKQTWLGVLGDVLYAPAGTETIEDLAVVCIARIRGRRSVEVEVNVRVDSGGESISPGAYKARMSQNEEDKNDGWSLNLKVDIGGMPVQDGSIAYVEFKVDETTATATLPVFLREATPFPLAKIENEEGGYAELE